MTTPTPADPGETQAAADGPQSTPAPAASNGGTAAGPPEDPASDDYDEYEPL